VETGGRFLLSNYQIPTNFDPKTDLLPAESFLHVYGEPCDQMAHKRLADLPIATAARLSATFPYISSASRVPPGYADYGYHFVDGGYYDNDGTGSAIEFLNAALQTPDPSRPADPCVQPDKLSDGTEAIRANTKSKTPSIPPLAILLIEIRNADDLDPLSNVDGLNFQEHPKNTHNWNAVSQLVAPIGALWQAGHESVTRRNRLGLCLLENAYIDHLVIHHVVFNFDPAAQSPVKKSDTDAIQPLNWHLTAGERAQIHAKAYADSATGAAIDNAKDWIKGMLGRDVAFDKAGVTAADKAAACHIAWVRAQPAPEK
jgi:hypothetical protein